jgi:hypothetical protein
MPGIGGTAARLPVQTATVAGGEREIRGIGATDHDPPVSVEPPGTPREIDGLGIEPLHLAVVMPMRGEAVPPAEDRSAVEPSAHRLGGAVDCLRRSERLADAEQRLAGHARPVRAVSAHELALNDRAGEATSNHAAGDVLSG